MTREDAVAYTILEHRSHEAGRQVLNGYGGIVVADGYGVYDTLARAGPRFTLAHCWAHVGRKFVEAAPHYPAPCAAVLGLIGQLYAVQRACPSLSLGADAAARAEVLRLRATLRTERSAPIVAEIRAWAQQQRVLPESGLGKAIAYLLGLWSGLTCSPIKALPVARVARLYPGGHTPASGPHDLRNAWASRSSAD